MQTFSRRAFVGWAAAGSLAGISPAASSEIKPLATTPRSFEDFGAVGDGRHDDTTALNQAARWSAANGQMVIGKAKANYLVTPTDQKSFLSPGGATFTARFALQLPSGACIDFKGATITVHGNGIGVCNENTVGKGDIVKLFNLTIDAKDGGEYGLLALGCQRSAFRNINVINGQVVGFALGASTGCDLDLIACYNSTGIGIMLGGNTAWSLSNCKIGALLAKNIKTLGTFHQPGNPMLIGAEDCSIASIDARNCGGGVKFTSGCARIICKAVYYDGLVSGAPDLRTENSGLKLQGDSLSAGVHDVTFDTVTIKNCAASGIYARYCQGIAINTYVGDNNGRWMHNADIDCGDASDLTIVSAFIAGSGARCIQVGTGAYALKMGRLTLGQFSQTRTYKEAILVAGGKVNLTEVISATNAIPNIRIAPNANAQAVLTLDKLSFGTKRIVRSWQLRRGQVLSDVNS